MPNSYKIPGKQTRKGLSGYTINDQWESQNRLPEISQSEARDLARLVLDRDAKKAVGTILDQQKKYVRMNGQTLEEYAREHIGSKSSWYAYKAAYQRGLAVDIRNAFNKADKARKKGDKEGAKNWRSHGQTLGYQLQEMDPDYQKQHQYQDIQSKYNGPKKRRKGHKYKSQGYPKAWRESLLTELKRTRNSHYQAALVSALTGCRPHELLQNSELPAITKVQYGLEKRPGIFISRYWDQENDTDLIQATIYSAKVTGVAGHPIRTLYFDPNENVYANLLKKILEEQGASEITVFIKVKSSFKNALIRAGQRIGLTGATGYGFRNRLCADFKATGVDEWTRAQAMGHRSVKTASAYGFASQGGGHGMAAAEGSVQQLGGDNGPVPIR